VLLDQSESPRDLTARETVVLGQSDRWLEPELRLAVGMTHVDMESRFLPRDDVEAEAAVPENRRAHDDEDTR
jgi:hypothetical protein